MLGYTKKLFILPFDHRASFIEGFFGEKTELKEEEIEFLKQQKQIIYEGFKKGIESGIPKDESAILVDEEYGKDILEDARIKEIKIIISVEKSGQKEFDFQYEDFATHLQKYPNAIAKALIHIESFKDVQAAKDQTAKLKKLNDWCRENNYKFLIEPLSFSSDSQLEDELFIIETLNNSGVEPDVWKLQGFYEKEEYEKISSQVVKNGRENVGIVILGGGEEKEKVEQMLKAGLDVNGVIGFAIGRTIFWEPLMALKNRQISKEEAVFAISQNYLQFYKIFSNN